MQNISTRLPFVFLIVILFYRCHIPISGIIGRIKDIEGTLHSLSPFAMKQEFDILTENKRRIIEIFSQDFGTALMIPISGFLSGRIKTHCKSLNKCKRGEIIGELGFGQNIIALLFRKDRIVYDTDLLKNSKNGLETFIRANQRIGVAAQPVNVMKKIV